MSENHHDLRQLLIFTKPARPGHVKTRLIGDLSAVQTAQLHQAFLEDVAHRLAAGRFRLRMAWALEAEEAVPEFLLDDGREIAGLRQEGASLGERLFRGLEGAARSSQLVAAVGSDHPSLPLERVDSAFELLEAGAEVVLGPAEDGGYYLIGCRRESLHERIFEEIPWSTEEVLEATRARCGELGLRVELLPRGADVDTPEDLMAFEEWLQGEPESCPRSRCLLALWARSAAETSP